MANDSGVVYNGNPTEMREGMAQLPDARYVLGTPEMETFISLLKNGDTAYALVQIATGGSHGKMELMGALQDRLIFIEKKGIDHLIIPYSEINRIEVSCGWVACGISIHKKDGNLIDFDSVLKVASKHFDSWFNSYKQLEEAADWDRDTTEADHTEVITGLGELFEGDVSGSIGSKIHESSSETPKTLAKAGNELGHLDDKPGSRHVDRYPESKAITRTAIEGFIRNTGWEIEKEGTTVWPNWWKNGQQKPKPPLPHLIYAKTGGTLRNMKGERIIVNTKRKTITSESRYRNVYGKNKSNVNKLKELINKELERERLNEEQKEKELKEREREEQEKQRKIGDAQDKEEHLDYDGAIAAYEEIDDKKSAKRVRKLKADQGAVKVDQTVVHGDYVDDRDTIVKDSVISKSNVGAGSDDKIAKLEKIAEMKDKGIIDDDEFKQMRRRFWGNE